jgi:SAUR family protein
VAISNGGAALRLGEQQDQGHSAASAAAQEVEEAGHGGAVGKSNVPWGSFVVYVGNEMQRFVIPTEYLGHWAFVELLREAEEEFRFCHEGVLRIPCDIDIFEGILQVVPEQGRKRHADDMCCYSETEILCR